MATNIAATVARPAALPAAAELAGIVRRYEMGRAPPGFSVAGDADR